MFLKSPAAGDPIPSRKPEALNPKPPNPTTLNPKPPNPTTLSCPSRGSSARKPKETHASLDTKVSPQPHGQDLPKPYTAYLFKAPFYDFLV